MNWDEFRDKLIQYDWTAMLGKADINDVWCSVKNQIRNITDRLCPQKWMNVISNKPLWLNSGLIETMEQRDRLFRIYRRSNGTRIDI